MELRYTIYITKVKINEITVHVTMMTQFFWDMTLSLTTQLLDFRRRLLSFCMATQSKNSTLLDHFGTEDEHNTFL